MSADDFRYLTLNGPSEGFYREKGSRFLAYATPARDEALAEGHIKALRKGHPKARHVCYAWRIGPAGERWRAVDDGEPSGTGGKPILGRLVAADLTYVCVAVVRYFGGTKLGAAGLARAYRDAASDALAQGIIVEHERTERYLLTCSYERLPMIEGLLNSRSWNVTKRSFDDSEGALLVEIPLAQKREFEYSIGEQTQVGLKCLKEGEED